AHGYAIQAGFTSKDFVAKRISCLAKRQGHGYESRLPESFCMAQTWKHLSDESADA
ncbi:MAG: hypothetical protein RLZZ46_1323, partial [Bacteroidota bacterium]